MNTNTCLKEQEIVIRKHLNFYRVFGAEQFTQEMFTDFSSCVRDFTKKTKSHAYINDWVTIKNLKPNCLDDNDADFSESIKTETIDIPKRSSNKRLMRALVGANRFRADLASTVNMLNHIYLLKTLIGHASQSSDHFLTLKLIEQYTLSIGALVLIFIRLINTLVDLYHTTNKYERQKKIQYYQYTLMMDLFMFIANIVNLMLIIFKQHEFLQVIPIISFMFEMIIGCFRYHDIYNAYDKQFKILTKPLENKFSEEYAKLETYEEKIAYLQNLLEHTENSSEKSIYLSLILLEQKTKLEAKKIAYNLLICSLVLIIFVIFEHLIFQNLLIQYVSPKEATLMTILTVYCCYLFKGLVLEVLVPHSLAKEVKLGDKYLLHGKIKQGSSEQTNLNMFSIVFRSILPLLSFVLLTVCSIETTVCVMLGLSVFQSLIGETIKDKQELVGESSDELFEENAGEEFVFHHDTNNYDLSNAS